MSNVVFSIGNIARLLANFFKMQGATKEITKHMQEEPKINTRGGSNIPEAEIKAEIEFKDVGFSYPTKPDV